MKTSAEQCLELHRRLGGQLNDRMAMLAEIRRMGAEQRLAEHEQKQWQRWVNV